MQRLSIVACLLAVCLVGSAQAQSFPNFVAALNQKQFSRLNQIVTTLGLTKTFSNPELKITVFVPTDDAFNKAAAASPVPIDSLLQNRAIVQQVVYYHIVKEVVSAPLPKREFQTFVTGRTLTGDGMTIKGVGSSAQITQSNIKCGSGLAQVINSVLLFVNVASLGR